MSKIINFKNIASLRKKFKQKKIVMCHGVFDLLHLGHIIHFEEAKKMGDILIVSVTSDKFVNKGYGRPYFNISDRMKSLCALNFIDYVIESDYPTAELNLKKLNLTYTAKVQNILNQKKIFLKIYLRKKNLLRKLMLKLDIHPVKSLVQVS